MNENLRSLLKRLSVFVETIELKGSGKSEFLYATGHGRSIEVSVDKGKYWVEYWDNLDEDANSVCDDTFDIIDAVEASVREWLSPQKITK